jgi:hypothetical protein
MYNVHPSLIALYLFMNSILHIKLDQFFVFVCVCVYVYMCVDTIP